MRIGIMLRSLDEKGGVGVYTRYVVEEMLAIDRSNDYILYYRNSANMGRYSSYANVEERVLPAKSKAIWDQVKIPLACRRDRVDIVFHPKFTIPLLSPCKTAMVLHGAGWFIPQHAKFWSKNDLRYINAVMPLYCRRATGILSVSKLTSEIFTERFKLPPDKIRTVYLAPGKNFSRVTDLTEIAAVRKRYRLPDRFIFTLSKFPGGDRKNIDGILKAFELMHDGSGHKLVVGGKDCDRYREIYDVPDDGYGRDVVFPGYIAQEDLPAIYSMADLFLYPSNMEAFPIPITEAMACGTPIVTSNQNGLEEVAGDAAIMVDPTNARQIADAAARVLADTELSRSLRDRGLERARQFTWNRCAHETLQVLESLVK